MKYGQANFARHQTYGATANILFKLQENKTESGYMTTTTPHPTPFTAKMYSYYYKVLTTRIAYRVLLFNKKK